MRKARSTRKPSSVRSRTRRKTPTNLSLRTDLVRRAKALELNISEVVEAALEAAIRELELAEWTEANQAAIAGYNAFIAEHGLFGDDQRLF
jgi:antitoxin CcdA